MSSLAGLLAANLALGVLGCGALLATGTWDRLRPASRIGPALLAGFALGATALPPLLYAGLSPTPLVAGALAAGALLLGTTLRRRRLRAEPDESGHGLLPAAVLALLLLPLTLRSAVEPLAKFDAYSNWMLKAKLLYGHGGLVSGALDPGMWSGLYAVSHREYPLGLPAVEALDFHAMGGADAQAIHLQIVIVVGAFLASAWSFLRPRVHPALLTAALCLPVAAPSLHTQVLSGYADVPMACLWAMAALVLGLWLRHGRGDLLALSGARGRRARGQAGGHRARRRARRRGRRPPARRGPARAPLDRLALMAGAVAATAVPWQLYVRSRHFRDADIAPSAGRSLQQIGQLPEIGHQLGAQLVWVKWPAIVPLAAAVAVLLALRRRDRAASAYLLLMTAALAALAFVYLNARVYVPALLERSAERVVLAPVLLSAIALPVLLSRLLEQPG